LLVCDTTEMVDALNVRIHHERVDPGADTVTVARSQKVAVGDVIISRRNDPTIEFHHSTPNAESLPSVRNGNRWRVALLDTERSLIGAERLDDNARAVFSQDYFRDHVTLGYAVTVHSAQGATADTSIAVLSETTSRNLLYVAMTRGRHTNHAHLYERNTEGGEFNPEQAAGLSGSQGGDDRAAADVFHAILANGELATTAHNYAAQIPDESLPDRVRGLLSVRAAGAERRRETYRAWRAKAREHDRSVAEFREQAISRNRSSGTDLGLEI
jgi:hypothetical protein